MKIGTHDNTAIHSIHASHCGSISFFPLHLNYVNLFKRHLPIFRIKKNITIQCMKKYFYRYLRENETIFYSWKIIHFWCTVIYMNKKMVKSVLSNFIIKKLLYYRGVLYYLLIIFFAKLEIKKLKIKTQMNKRWFRVYSLDSMCVAIGDGCLLLCVCTEDGQCYSGCGTHVVCHAEA